MRRILDRKSTFGHSRLMQNKRGQVMIINIVMMLMALLVFMAVLPLLKEQIDSARNYDVLNCKETDATRICSSNGGVSPCYNASYSKSETMGCSMLSLYVPYILVIVLLMGAAKLMANKVDSMFTQQPTYG